MKGRKPSIDEIKDVCTKLSLIYIDSYNDSHDTVIQYICEKHPTVGIQISTWSHLKNATFGCRICCGKYRSAQEFILGNPQINPNVHILGTYTGYNKPISYECNDCGNKWDTAPASLRTGSGCPVCERIKCAISRRMPEEEFIRRVYNNNPDIEVVSAYLGFSNPITCRCKIDGTVFTVSSARNLLYENVQCPLCSTSKAEKELFNILKECGYNYIFHYKFDDCRYVHTLEFDFAILDDNNKLLYLIEYDGEQHYKPIDFAGKGPEWAKNQLEIVQTII